MSYSKLTEQLSFRVSKALYDLMEEIARKERRKPNEVARALLERGAAAFRRDGLLFEPLEVAAEFDGSGDVAFDLTVTPAGPPENIRIPAINPNLARDKKKA